MPDMSSGTTSVGKAPRGAAFSSGGCCCWHSGYSSMGQHDEDCKARENCTDQNPFPFESIWQLPDLFEKLGGYGNSFGGLVDEYENEEIAYMQHCLMQLTKAIFSSVLPAFLLDLGVLLAKMRSEVDMGKSIQTKVVAAGASILISVLTMSLQVDAVQPYQQAALESVQEAPQSMLNLTSVVRHMIV